MTICMAFSVFAMRVRHREGRRRRVDGVCVYWGGSRGGSAGGIHYGILDALANLLESQAVVCVECVLND